MKRLPVIQLFLCGASFAGACAGTACDNPQRIVVDLSSEPPRFLIHHPGWGSPMVWPGVQEFAIASEEDGSVWELKSTDPGGVPADHLAIIYGHLPDGFFQVYPAENAPPVALTPDRTYFVGANGTAGGYTGVFSLPVDLRLHVPQPDLLPGARREGERLDDTSAPANPAG